MRQLVALDLPAGETFVDELRRAWDGGDAVVPVDQRLAPAARLALLQSLALHVLVDAAGRHALAGGRMTDDGDALVVATSGTTGAPKGVVLTHAAVAASAIAASARLAVDPQRDRWLCCLPVAHVGGLAVITRALVTGTPLTIHGGFDAAAVEAAAVGGCTLVSLVATALDRIDAEPFRRVVLGGSRPPPSVPPNAAVTYGMTETGSGVVYDGEPLDGVEVRIAPDGEVHLRGPMLLRAYRDGTDPRDRDGWFATGDDGAWVYGRLVVHGRRGDVIVTGGEKVWPDPVEAILAAVPGVADVAVAGRDDPEWGQRVVAYVVAHDPANPPRLAALREAVRNTLTAYAAPRELVLVDQLPRTALGKVRRAALSDRR